jgi:hypothetical protein
MPTTRKVVNEGPQTIDILRVDLAEFRIRLRGTTPLICNRLSEKARRELLLPSAKKNTAERQSSMKHNPMQEFRDSPYTIRGDAGPTLIGVPIGAFKKAIATAALDLPGAFKSQIGRLVSVDGTEWRDLIPIYGEPQLLASVVRMADVKRTPDVRFRAILPEWVADMTIRFVSPTLREQAVLNLMGAAGITVGVCDYRTEKGAGNYGSWEVVGADDARANEIVATWGRKAQIGAMNNPQMYDQETEDLLSWFDVEAPKRGFKVA